LRINVQILSARDRLKRQLLELLGAHGVLFFPSFPTVAQYHNEPLCTPLNMMYTAVFNALALPVVQCPMGLNVDGIPLGVQIVSAPGNDRLLIDIAREIERAFGGWCTPPT
jgi:fatty acid amide hydrolase 2